MTDTDPDHPPADAQAAYEAERERAWRLDLPAPVTPWARAEMDRVTAERARDPRIVAFADRLMETMRMAGERNWLRP